MDLEQPKENSIVSVLKMRHIVCDELSFVRIGFQNDHELQVRANIDISTDSENKVYRVILGLIGEKKDEYSVKAQVSGYFEIDQNHPMKNELLQKNAAAILFPFARAQLTLLTAQPETNAIVLPTFNINAMIDQAQDIED